MINIEKSIIRKKIIRERTFGGTISYFFDVIFWLIYPVCLILILFNDRYYPDFPFLIWLLNWLPVVWCLYGYKYLNKMVYLGKHDEISKGELIDAFIFNYNVTLICNNENLIILKKQAGLFNWGKEMTLVISGENVWCNMITLGRWDIKSPFHSYSNYIKLLSM